MMRCLLFAVAAILILNAASAAASVAVQSAIRNPKSEIPPPTASDTVWQRFIVRSPATGKIERFWVGHAKGLDPAARHGVVYFLPGLLDTENHWKQALDPHLGRFNLIAVCPSVGGATWFMNSPAHDWMRWGNYLTDELRPFVESNFPASREKGQRGIAGISAGAHGALYHALRTPDLYASVSLLSGALDLPAYAGQVGLDYWIGPRTPEMMPLYAERSTLRLLAALETPPPFALLLDTADKDGALPQMQILRQILDARRIPYAWHEGRGAHNWAYWSSRAADHLAWHAERFAENRRDARYTDQTPAPPALSGVEGAGPALEILTGYPDVTLSDEALARLRAPLAVESPRMSPRLTGANPRDPQSLAVAGIPAGGSPIPLESDPEKPVPFTAPLTARGYEPVLAVYRLTLTLSTPVAEAGTVTLATTLCNGRSQYLLTVPAVALPVPAGAPPRNAALRVRLAVELKAPDPLRGGIVCALQVFGEDGRPVGEPVVGKARPGTPGLDFWPLGPQAQAQCALALPADGPLRYAALLDARLEEEPRPPP